VRRNPVADRPVRQPRLRCRAGHAFSPDSLLLGKQDAVERALATAVVALEERAELDRRIIQPIEGSSGAARLARYREAMATDRGWAQVLRQLPGGRVASPPGDVTEEASGVDSAD